MLNIVIRTAAYTVASLIVRDTYPTVKKTCLEAYDTVCDWLSSEESKPTTKQPRDKLTEYQYAVIMEAYELNNALPKKDKINQQELCDRLNNQLGLNYSRSGYAHYFRKRIIPNFEESHDE